MLQSPFEFGGIGGKKRQCVDLLFPEALEPGGEISLPFGLIRIAVFEDPPIGGNGNVRQIVLKPPAEKRVPEPVVAHHPVPPSREGYSFGSSGFIAKVPGFNNLPGAIISLECTF